MCCLGARNHVLELEKYFGVKKSHEKTRKKNHHEKKMSGEHGIRSRDPRHSKHACYHYSTVPALQTPEIAPFIKCCLLCTQYTLSFFLSLHVNSLCCFCGISNRFRYIVCTLQREVKEKSSNIFASNINNQF